MCLWTVAPKAHCDVGIQPNGSVYKMALKRRLIVSGWRLHMFVFNAPGFRAAEPNALSFRVEPDAPLIHAEAVARLANWHAPLIGSVLRSLVEALGDQHPDGIHADLLAKFLGLVAAWRVPCLSTGRCGSFHAAVFQMGPLARDVSDLLIADGAFVRRKTVNIIPVANDRSCLLWQGDSFQSGYLDTGTELLELPVASERASPRSDFNRWFSGFGPGDRGRILDGWIAVSDSGSRGDLIGLGNCFPKQGSIDVGFREWQVLQIVASGPSLFCFLRGEVGTTARMPKVSIGPIDLEPLSLTLQHALLPEPQLFVFAAAVEDASMLDGPVRVAIEDDDWKGARWHSVSPIDEAETRQWLLDNVPWHLADDALVEGFGVDMAKAGDRAIRLPFSEIAIRSGTGRLGRGLLVVCVHDGDLAALQMTLLALSFPEGRVGTRLRIIARGHHTPAEIQALHTLCRQHEVDAAVVLVPKGAPLSPALQLKPEDRQHDGVVYLNAGIVPLDRQWRQSLSVELGKHPGSVFVPPIGANASEGTFARDLAASSGLFAAVGGDIAEAIVCPHAELLTFEGFVAHMIGFAERDDVLVTLGDLRFQSPRETDRPDVFGRARLDDAAIASRLATREDNVRRLPLVKPLAAHG